MAEAAVIKEDDPRFKFGPPRVQTAEDAAFAYLRGEITEEELREACNRYGVVPGSLLQKSSKGERPDAAFENKLPDDLYQPLAEPTDNVELRQKLAEIKQNTRDEATKAHEAAVVKEDKADSELATKQQELREKENEEVAKALESETDRSSTRSAGKSTTQESGKTGSSKSSS